MAINLNIAKISVEKFDNKEQVLYDFDKSLGLCENVRQLCKKLGLPESPVYGLKFLPTKENPSANSYVSEKNYEDIKHNDCIKLVFSVDYMSKRILDNIHTEKLRPICFNDLMKLCMDAVFIEEIVSLGRHKELIELFVTDILTSSEQLALLITVVHLIQKGHITDTSQDILGKTVTILQNSDTTSGELKYALSILHKILISKNPEFTIWKEKIIQSISITELNPYIWTENNIDLQYGALLLINTLIRSCKGEKKLMLIREMNLRKNRENIYTYIILSNKADRNMEHELYVTQTYLLSLFTEALNSEININDNNLFRREEFELCSDDIKRITILMDFDDDNFRTFKDISVENLVTYRGDERVSLASNFTDISSRISSVRSSKYSIFENEQTTINYLTLEALRHYKKYHYKNFYQSQIEEKVYEPGLFITSERVVKILAKILDVGVDPPDAKSTFYQPIVFYCSPKTPFFLELFSRSMWLLSKTRREMKASTIEDYPKVMHIVEKQVKLALEAKPRDFKCLTDEMSMITFEKIMMKIEGEKETEFKSQIQNNQCIQELKEILYKQNEPHVNQQRINFLLNGAHFPKVFEKKTSGNIFVQLSKNRKEILVFDMVDVKKGKMSFQQKFNVADITHVVTGKNCKHSNLCNKPSLAFSLIIEHEEKIKFIAKDEKSAAYWIDGFNLLIGHNKRSEHYAAELEELVEMDIRLQLLELQNVAIPKHPPPVPPNPLENRPPVPPKSEILKRLNKTNKKRL